MAKEFSVPPLVFPYLGSISVSHQRRTLTPVAAASPFQPLRPSNSGTANPSIPFIFLRHRIRPRRLILHRSIFAPSGVALSVSGCFEDEPPLLEELGINTRQIWRKTLSILNPFWVNASLHEDADVSGPFLFCVAFSLFQLLAGKFHFGIILGWVTAAALFLYVVFNMLAGRNEILDLYLCLSLIGYSMLPMVILASLSLFVPHGGAVIFSIDKVFELWSTRMCTALLLELGLIAYSCSLAGSFTCFSLICSLFSDSWLELVAFCFLLLYFPTCCCLLTFESTRSS